MHTTKAIGYISTIIFEFEGVEDDGVRGWLRLGEEREERNQLRVSN
jgi:hypothetical protein